MIFLPRTAHISAKFVSEAMTELLEAANYL
jgi:hypothetical protein